MAVTVPFGRCVASSGIQGIERLAFRVDANVRVVLKHPARQMAADRLEHVIRDAHLCEFGDDRVPQIVEPQAKAASGLGSAKRMDAGPCVATTPSRLATLAGCRRGRVLCQPAGNGGRSLGAVNPSRCGLGHAC